LVAKADRVAAIDEYGAIGRGRERAIREAEPQDGECDCLCFAR
jgi:hypothetical protein